MTEIGIPGGRNIRLQGNLIVPEGAVSLVLFSHGSGSSRFSRRNNFVASQLNMNKIATLLTDLLTAEEDRIYENRFNIDLLTMRLVRVTEHVIHLPIFKNFPVGYFGASTGAASALEAAARLGSQIHAIVSRGGRPDLAAKALPLVKAPTLLIVGSQDEDVIKLNKSAFAQLHCVKQMEIIEGATHLFEEAGKLEEVARLAVHWFKKYLAKETTSLTNYITDHDIHRPV